MTTATMLMNVSTGTNGTIVTRNLGPVDYMDYIVHRYWHEEGDPRTKDFPMMNYGLMPVLVLLTVYILFVKVVGPRLMRDREPFQLRTVIIIYNIINVLVNIFFFFATIFLLDYGKRMFQFDFPDRTDTSTNELRICFLSYTYMWCKVFDLLDTIFFVLRKKQSQITFLHLYHHSIVPLIMWMGIRLVPTAGPAGVFPLLNSVIHSIMYTYYALAAMGPEYQKYLFWKKYITIIQLIQFVCYIVHGTVFLILQRGYPSFIVYVSYIQSPLFFFLFYQFFKSTYITSKKAKKD